MSLAPSRGFSRRFLGAAAARHRRPPREGLVYQSVLFPLVLVESAPALPAQAAGEDHLLQERRRREALLAVLLEHDVGDVVGGVQADEVEEGEGAHRVAAAE